MGFTVEMLYQPMLGLLWKCYMGLCSVWKVTPVPRPQVNAIIYEALNYIQA